MNATKAGEAKLPQSSWRKVQPAKEVSYDSALVGGVIYFRGCGFGGDSWAEAIFNSTLGWLKYGTSLTLNKPV